MVEQASDIGRRVGFLEQKVAGIASVLDGLSSTLQEIKAGIATARPSMWTVLPIVLSFVAMVVAGVVSVTSIKGDISSLYAVKEARERELEHIDRRLSLLEHRDYDAVRTERDYWRMRAGGGSHVRTEN